MYDLIIIGAGTAGISAYKEAVKHTQNLLIINEGPWDTTCARVGCMPSKVLISSANRAHDAQHLTQVGLSAELQLNSSQLMQHVRQLRDRFTKATLKDVESWPKQHKLNGRAEFVNANTVAINGEYLQAKAFVIAVGSTPQFETELKEKLGNRLLSSDDIFEIEVLPKSMAVIGSGVIALELAQAFHRLGVHTHIFARSRKVGALTSPQLQTLAQTQFSQELNLHFETLPQSYELNEHGVKIHFTEQEKTQTLDVDYVLTATGRRSLLSTLKLENIDQSYNDLKKLPVDAQTKQLADLPIFIAGDAYTNTPIQHEAAHEGRTSAYNALHFPMIKSAKTLTPLAMVFCQPEMASVGQNHKQLTQSNVAFVTGYIDYSRQGRAIVMGKNQGAVEIYVHKESRKILGAELFCEAAEHFAHSLAWLMASNMNIDDILAQPFYHPTLEEGLRTALKHARRQLNQPSV